MIFKLSYLQTDWLLITWISFFLAVMAFWWVFEVLTRLYDGWSAADMGSVYKYYSSGLTYMCPGLYRQKRLYPDRKPDSDLHGSDHSGFYPGLCF